MQALACIASASTFLPCKQHRRIDRVGNGDTARNILLLNLLEYLLSDLFRLADQPFEPADIEQNAVIQGPRSNAANCPATTSNAALSGEIIHVYNFICSIIAVLWDRS